MYCFRISHFRDAFYLFFRMCFAGAQPFIYLRKRICLARQWIWFARQRMCKKNPFVHQHWNRSKSNSEMYLLGRVLFSAPSGSWFWISPYLTGRCKLLCSLFPSLVIAIRYLFAVEDTHLCHWFLAHRKKAHSTAALCVFGKEGATVVNLSALSINFFHVSSFQKAIPSAPGFSNLQSIAWSDKGKHDRNFFRKNWPVCILSTNHMCENWRFKGVWIYDQNSLRSHLFSTSPTSKLGAKDNKECFRTVGLPKCAE